MLVDYDKRARGLMSLSDCLGADGENMQCVISGMPSFSCEAHRSSPEPQEVSTQKSLTHILRSSYVNNWIVYVTALSELWTDIFGGKLNISERMSWRRLGRGQRAVIDTINKRPPISRTLRYNAVHRDWTNFQILQWTWCLNLENRSIWNGASTSGFVFSWDWTTWNMILKIAMPWGHNVVYILCSRGTDNTIGQLLRLS